VIKTVKSILLIAGLSVLMSGCTGLKKLPEGEYLFTGHSVKFDSTSLLTSKKATLNELNDLVSPSPNTKFLWMRPFLSIHNMVKEPDRDKGLRYWLKYKLGKPPALLSEVKVDLISDAMTNRMENRGYFQASTTHNVEKKKKTATVDFEIYLHPPYTLRNISFPKGNDDLPGEIGNNKEASLLNSGDQYNLDVFRKERERIEEILKNKGYFYFNPSHIIFEADTTVGDRQIDVGLTLKEDMPSNARKDFRLNDIYVFDDYALSDYNPDTLIVDDYFYVTNRSMIRPRTVLKSVFLQKDSLYARRDHFNTLNNLMGLGIYKFANIRFKTSDEGEGLLDADIFLTPGDRMSLRMETNATIKSNNFAGPGIRINYKDRNIFRGAEILSVTLGGRFESQISGPSKGDTSFEITLDASLTLPDIVPFDFDKTPREFVSNTIINIGGGLFSRVELYRLNSFNASYGFSWRPSRKRSFEFKPIDISYTQLTKSSDEFETYLTENPNIRKSFEEQLIPGASFQVVFSDLFRQDQRTNFFYLTGIDISGNLAGVIKNAAGSEVHGDDDQYHILGVPYSQFVRIKNDLRYFIRVGRTKKLAMRLQVSAGLPYLNSTTMPYIKQFYVGGTTSVRAFRARSVGPGTYALPDSVKRMFVDQSGDIKVETSLEYRFPIYSYFKGAFFVDAGNIWLTYSDEQRPGSKFRFNSFYRELAIGAGLGLRIDIDFFVIRFDLAFPLRRPDLPENERWVFGDMDFGSGKWRSDNLILNIAIGYPF
jgi:outer membrane protein assembly factor BamA